MCTVLLPPVVNTIVVNKYVKSYHIISYHIISYHIISYIISYHIISYHIISYHISPLIRTDTALSIPLTKGLNSLSLTSKDQFVNCMLQTMVVLDNRCQVATILILQIIADSCISRGNNNTVCFGCGEKPTTTRIFRCS